MDGQAITFDFHNTIARCPEWFDLEVKHLPSAFLRWQTNEDPGDVNTVLHQEADDRYRQLRKEIIEHGNELSAEQCLQHVFVSMNIVTSDEELAEGVEQVMHATFSGVSPIPGAVETVRSIHSLGIPVGIVSSAVYHPFLEWTLTAFGIRDAIGTIVTSASAGYYKSRPEIYLHAAELLGSLPGRTVHVGDSLRFDVGGAMGAGMGTVWLQHDAESAINASFIPDLVVRTLEDSAPLIVDLLNARSEGREFSGA
jgi:FMN phosphatase YigB (HAD superfamily)